MMKLAILLSAIISLFLMSPVSFAEQGNNTSSENNKTFPMPNLSVLLDKPVKTINKGNKIVDFFESKNFKYIKTLDYAWVTSSTLDDECMVIAWIHGDKISKRIIFKSKKRNNFCSVYISRLDFEEDFKYCLLSGINVSEGRKLSIDLRHSPV